MSSIPSAKLTTSIFITPFVKIINIIIKIFFSIRYFGTFDLPKNLFVCVKICNSALSDGVINFYNSYIVPHGTGQLRLPTPSFSSCSLWHVSSVPIFNFFQLDTYL